MITIITLLCLIVPAKAQISQQQAYQSASEALIARVVPAHARSFAVKIIPTEGDHDVFEIEAGVGKRQGRIVLRGNNPVSVASALNWYLKYDCHCQMSWCGDNLALPARLPTVAAKIRHVTPYRQRVDFNYCTFSYTMAWWDWDRWQREIDWMALHGVNMPLAITGQEAVWQATLRRFGMSDDEIRRFLVGPAFFAWQWMTNIQSYGGPLPQSWIRSHAALGKRILERERSLGMTPILQGFTGYVPLALMQKQPQARIARKPLWCNVGPGTAQMDPLDPLFRKFGDAFLEEQQKLFGTDHLYAADPFHEGSPPVKGDAYLTAVGKAIWDQTSAFDPQATVVMQAWSLRKPIVDGIPADKILILDLVGDYWRKYDGYWGRPWVAGIIHNYGGRAFLGGNLDYLANNPATLRATPGAGNVTGIGLFPEGSEQNPIVYELELENTWHDKPIDLDDWLPRYVTARYGADNPEAQRAWAILRKTVYAIGHNTQAIESPICGRPALAFRDAAPYSGGTHRDYAPSALWPALDDLLKAKIALSATDTYRYDVTDLTRQVLADLSIPLQQQAADDYRRGDATAFAAHSARFLALMDDMDTMLATRREFLLGKWTGDAARRATTPAERALYERNARAQITTWGPPSADAALSDYSNRQWSGLISDYYKPRWSKFFAYLREELAKPAADRFTDKGLKTAYGRPLANANAFYQSLSDWEYAWSGHHVDYPAAPHGDSLAIAQTLYARWLPVLRELNPPEQRVGDWTPAQMSTAETAIDWDVTPAITAPGKYVFRVAYASGQHALAVSQAELVRDGVVIARDTHDGWTGLDEYGQRYTLPVGAQIFMTTANVGSKPARYTLRLHLRSDGGTDSRGTVYVAREAWGK